jgi:murein DD-endopeptidase MepM/ murein hydrolase activator NlpD
MYIMTNISSPISSISPTPGSGNAVQSSNSSTSTADIISSFKEILSVMTATSGLSSSGQSAGMGMNMGDLMAPLMMLMIERLLELELNQNNSSSTEQSSSTADQAGIAQASAAGLNQSSPGVMGSRPSPSGWPVTGRISQEPHTGHMAFDIAVPVGTPIKTTMDGKVVHAGWNNQGYGNLVIVENGGYRTYYAHLTSIPVSVGDQVAAGTVIGLSGNTGHSTGPHLHYEIRQNNVAINPTALTRGAS